MHSSPRHSSRGSFDPFWCLESDIQLSLSRYTFSWIAPLLDKAQILDSLELSDLPEMDSSARAQTLRSSFEKTQREHRMGERRLWRIIYQDHKRRFLREWSLAAIEPFALMFPQICLFRILTILEHRVHSTEARKELWLWILALGVSKLVHLLLETWYVDQLITSC